MAVNFVSLVRERLLYFSSDSPPVVRRASKGPSALLYTSIVAGRVFLLLDQFLGHRQFNGSQLSLSTARTIELRCDVERSYRPDVEMPLSMPRHFSENDS